MSHPPTEEQVAILEATSTGSHVRALAGAGTGKTTTLELIADLMARHGLVGVYITLNKSMAMEVGSRFKHGNIYSSTIHSLAWRLAQYQPLIASLLPKIGSDATVSRFQYARHLRFGTSFTYTGFQARHRREAGMDAKDTTIMPNDIILDALDAIRTWCKSDRTEITTFDVRRPATMPPEVWSNEYAPMVADAAKMVWEYDLLAPDGRVRFEHDFYLKLVSLWQPRFTQVLGLPPGSLIFFDEAQDARPCVTSLLVAQDDMQMIAVGDEAQAIYRFTGGSGRVPAPDTRNGTITLPLTTSWRFGQEVADEANRLLELLDSEIRLRGNPNKVSCVTQYSDDADPPEADAVLVRTNARLITEAMRESRRGRAVALMTDATYIRRVLADVDKIDAGERPTTQELRDFTSMEELREFVSGNGSDGGTTKAIVRIALEEGTDQVRAVLDSAVPEDRADVVIATAHKSKGQQWPRVRLAMEPHEIIPGHSARDDGVYDEHGALTRRAEDSLMLLYVAVTRAQDELMTPETTAAALIELEKMSRSRSAA